MHELTTFYQLQQQAQELLQQSQNKILAAQMQLTRSQSIHNQSSIAAIKTSTTKQPAQRSLSDISAYYHTSNQREYAPTRSPPGFNTPIQKPVAPQLILAQLPQTPCVALQRRESVKSDSGAQTLDSTTRYKTEMCRPFEETGHCRYGSKCQFAHGASELRGLNRHPRYKTEFCRTFHTTGFCSYGQRCNFIHNEDERRTPTAPTRPPTLPVALPSMPNSSGSSPASSIYGDVSPTHSPSYTTEDPFTPNRLSPAPSLSSFSSDIGSSMSFPSPPGTPLEDFASESKTLSSQLDFGLSYYLNNLNLRQ